MHWSFEPFSVPLESPLDTASDSIEERSGWLVRVTLGDERGLGEATPLPGWTESHKRCKAALESAIEALNRTERAHTAVQAAIEDIPTPAARHGCSLALADLRARQADEPLYQWLGTDTRVDAVPVNATVGDHDLDETVDRSQAAVDEGYDCVKIKIGVRDPELDAARLRAVREQVGDHVTLRGDVNGVWALSTAREALSWLADVEVAYVEQPLPADRLNEHAALRGAGVDIALDESVAEEGIERIFDAAAADVIVCKPMVLGGIDRTLDVARSARERGTEPIVTTTIDAAVARAGARHLGAALQPTPPLGLATGELLGADLVSTPDEISQGAAALSQTPGHGIELG